MQKTEFDIFGDSQASVCLEASDARKTVHVVPIPKQIRNDNL